MNKKYINKRALDMGLIVEGNKCYSHVPSPEEVGVFGQECYADGLRVATNLAKAKLESAEAFMDHKAKQHDLHGELSARGAWREVRHIAEELQEILEKFEAEK